MEKEKAGRPLSPWLSDLEKGESGTGKEGRRRGCKRCSESRKNGREFGLSL